MVLCIVIIVHACFIFSGALPEDPIEYILSFDDEPKQSFSHQGAGSLDLSCTELCCPAGSEISQPTNPAILKTGVLDLAKMLVNNHLCHHGTSSFHGFIFVALNTRCTASIVKVLMILVQR